MTNKLSLMVINLISKFDNFKNVELKYPGKQSTKIKKCMVKWTCIK